MRELAREIEEVRKSRGDLSNWLVHLTKDNVFKVGNERVSRSSKECLENILNKNVIQPGTPIGHFRFSDWYGKKVQESDLKAVCFTETPIEEIFLFTNIKGKRLKFSSYGLVFSKDDLQKAPYFAAPVIYFSQPGGNRHYLDVIMQMGTKHYDSFKKILFLFHSFGKTIAGTSHDFRWEREWRKSGSLENILGLVKFGLCPEKDIDFFEDKFPSIAFVDPFFNPKQIEKKLEIKGAL